MGRGAKDRRIHPYDGGTYFGTLSEESDCNLVAALDTLGKMTNVNQQWQSGQGPIGPAIFYADGSYRPAIFKKSNGSISFGGVREMEEQSDFAEYCEYENGRFKLELGLLRWGGGPWEGEGWIALEDHAGDLVWVLHLEDSEPFTQARYFSGMIEAVAYEYPTMSSFSIPPQEPHLATCSRA